MTERGFEQVALGNTDMAVSAVGFGTYHLREKIGPSEAIDAMGAAYEAGITLFDTSDNYGTEELIGLAVREDTLPRDEIVIATKTGLATSWEEHLAFETEDRRIDTSPERIRRQVEKSLRLLGEDVGIIDLYQLHGKNYSGYLTAPVMNELIKEGKIRAYGVSNYSVWDMVDILDVCEQEGLIKPATTQPFANAIHGFDDIESAFMAHQEGMTILAHSPLHKGMLSEAMIEATDKYIKSREEKGDETTELDNLREGLDILNELSERALEAGHNLARLGIAWTSMYLDMRTVVLSAPTDKSRLEDVRASANWRLDDETLDAIDAAQARFKKLNFNNMSLNLMKAMRAYYR